MELKCSDMVNHGEGNGSSRYSLRIFCGRFHVVDFSKGVENKDSNDSWILCTLAQGEVLPFGMSQLPIELMVIHVLSGHRCASTSDRVGT